MRMTPEAAEQQLLVFIMLLAGVSALAWLVLSRLMRVAPRASLFFSFANALLLVGIALLYQREAGSQLWYWQGSDLAILLAFISLKAGFVALFKRQGQVKWDLSILMIWLILALQVSSENREQQLGVLFSLFAFCYLGHSTYILYKASAQSFNNRYALAISAPLVGISLLFLLRLLSTLVSDSLTDNGLLEDRGNLYWVYLLFVLLVNITIFSSTLVRLVAKIRHLADRDQLTGLYNRLVLDREISVLHQQYIRHQHPYALLLMDLDHFKKINDTYGHLAGDKVLQHAAALFRDNIRQGDVVGRFGGEEFMVLLPMTTLRQAETVANKLLAVLREHPVEWKGHRISLTTSIGIAAVSDASRSSDYEPVLQHADKALYRAKEDGRDRAVSLERS